MNTNNNESADPAEVHVEPERDELLQILAATLQGAGEAELPLTVTVGGLLISGLAIGRDQWFREAARFMEESGGTGDIPKAFLAAFEEADCQAPGLVESLLAGFQGCGDRLGHRL